MNWMKNWSSKALFALGAAVALVVILVIAILSISIYAVYQHYEVDHLNHHAIVGIIQYNLQQGKILPVPQATPPQAPPAPTLAPVPSGKPETK